MKSIKLLPLDKRGKATSKQLIEALELAESELLEYDTQSTKVIYKSMKSTVCKIAREIEDMELTDDNGNQAKRVIESAEKTFDRILKFFDLAGDYDKTIESLRSKINPDEANKIDAETAVHPTLRFAKNGQS